MTEEDQYRDATHWFGERRDGTWELRSAEAGKPILIFRSRGEAVKFAESLMDEAGPWKVVFQSLGRRSGQEGA